MDNRNNDGYAAFYILPFMFRFRECLKDVYCTFRTILLGRPTSRGVDIGIISTRFNFGRRGVIDFGLGGGIPSSFILYIVIGRESP